MNSEGHFFWWVSRILAVVCLLLLALNLLLPSREENTPPNPEPAIAGSEFTPAQPIQDVPPQGQRAGTRARPYTIAGKHRVERADARVRRYNAPPAPPPEPALTTLKPMGYVEKADGTVEAVVSDGPFVAILREGELYGEGLRVARITPWEVELEKAPAPAATLVADAEARAETVVELASLQGPRSSRGVSVGGRTEVTPGADTPSPSSVPDRGEERPSADGLAGSGKGESQRPVAASTPALAPDGAGQARRLTGAVAPTPAPWEALGAGSEAALEPSRTFEPIGFVEWASGRVEAVVEYEGEIHLVTEGEVFADRFRAVTVSRSLVRVVESANPPLHHMKEGRPARDSPIEFAGPVAGRQPASKSVNRRTGRGRGAPTITGQQGDESEDSDPRTARAGTGVPRSPPGGTLATLGYVERAKGQVEVIVLDEGEVCLVSEGEVFSERYLALRVSPPSVDVVGDLGQPGRQPPVGKAESEPGEQLLSEPPVAVSHSPPGAGPETEESQEEASSVSETASELMYLVTEVRGSRFNFDLHVRLPDNRSQ